MAEQRTSSPAKKATKAGTTPKAKVKASSAVSSKSKSTKVAATKKSAAIKAATKANPADTRRIMVKLTPEERYRMVETTAYFIAERHGFQGPADEHWAAAEREVAARLGYHT